MRLEEERVRTINGYRGIIVNTRLDYARLPDGSMALREVVEHPGGVAVLPLEADGTVWCVRQYRYPFSELLLEVPAGKLEPGEVPEQAARRELSEETGLDLLFARLQQRGTAHLSRAGSAPRRLPPGRGGVSRGGKAQPAGADRPRPRGGAARYENRCRRSEDPPACGVSIAFLPGL